MGWRITISTRPTGIIRNWVKGLCYFFFFFRELLEKNQRALNYHQFWSSEAKKRENAYTQDWWDEIERPGFWIQNPRLEFQFYRLCNLESRFLHLWDMVQFYTLAPPGVWRNPGVLKKTHTSRSPTQKEMVYYCNRNDKKEGWPSHQRDKLCSRKLISNYSFQS